MNLQSLVLDAARRTPEATAIVAPDMTMSYAELSRSADVVGRTMLTQGVQPGARIGVWLPKAARGIAAMQGALRIGAAYVPLDPGSPASRIAGIVKDCGLACVVTTEERGAKLLAEGVEPNVLLGLEDIDWNAPGAADDETALRHQVGPDELAYILYTSGSTGKPKGVCISHGNARAFVDWAVDALSARRTDRFSNHAPFHFDLSVLDLYGAFSVGAAVCLVPESVAYLPGKLVSFALEHEITLWYSVPSALVLMMDHASFLDVIEDSALRTIIFAGEPFPIAHLRQLREATERVQLWNFYGPTETNVCTAYEVESLAPDARAIPIGHAVSGDEGWVVAEDGHRVEPGDVGELVIDGPTVMMGYFGAEPHQGPYPTGDLVRVTDDGYEYIGRRDHMVKLRGHRVELGEIEAVLAEHPAIRQVAVTLEGHGLQARLIAHVVPEDGDGPALLDLKAHCAAHLPRYMIVDQCRRVDALPRTGNGKLDRRKLVQERPPTTHKQPGLAGGTTWTSKPF